MKPKTDHNFLLLLVCALLLLILGFTPLPKKVPQSYSCPLVYPDTCPLEYNLVLGPSLFEQFATSKPTPDTSKIESRQFCGGIAANLPENQCPKGYGCKLENNYPDASGICIKE